MSADTDLRGTVANRQDLRASAVLDEAMDNTFPPSDPVARLEPAADQMPDRPVVKRMVEARQGVTGHNVRYVLGWGIAGIVIAFAIIYLIYRV